MKASKLFNWIWSKKQPQQEYFFEPVWTPREINDQKYEARQRRERYLAAKYLNDRQIINLSACSHGPAVECNLYLSPKKSLLNYFFPNIPIYSLTKH